MVSIQGDEYLTEPSVKAPNSAIELVDYSIDSRGTGAVKKKFSRSTPKFESRLLSLTMAVVVVFFLCSGATSILNFASGLASASQLGGPPTKTITVKQGDTLWQIASRYGDPNAYILDRVESIAHINHLSDDATLVPGEKIRVPVVASSS